MLIEPTGAVIDRVDDNHTATTDTDGDQKCLEGCSEEVATAAGAVKPARQRQPSKEEARDRVGGATTDRRRDVLPADVVGAMAKWPITSAWSSSHT